MGSSGGGGGSSYDDAPMKAKAKKGRQKAEENALVTYDDFGNKTDAYARSGSSNTIVRSGSGSGVVTSKGEKARDDYREDLFNKSDLAKETTDPFGDKKFIVSEKGKDVARMQLEYRQLKDPIANLGKALPFGIGTAMMGIGSMNRKAQLDRLSKGGSPQFKYTESGRFVVGGVSRPSEGGDSQVSGTTGGNVIDSFQPEDNGGEELSIGTKPTSETKGTTPVSTPSKQASTAARRLLNQSAEKSAKRRNLLNRPSV